MWLSARIRSRRARRQHTQAMSSDAAKRSRDEGTFTLDDLDDFAPADATHPLSFMSWNANGLLNRIRGGKRDPPGRVPRAAHALNEAIIRCKPDAIALQEVWLKASGGPTKNNQSRKWCVRRFCQRIAVPRLNAPSRVTDCVFIYVF